MTDLPEGALAQAAARQWPRWPETRDVIAILSTLDFLVACDLPWFVAIPHGSEQNVGQMQGALLLQWGAIMSWYADIPPEPQLPADADFPAATTAKAAAAVDSASHWLTAHSQWGRDGWLRAQLAKDWCDGKR